MTMGAVAAVDPNSHVMVANAATVSVKVANVERVHETTPVVFSMNMYTAVSEKKQHIVQERHPILHLFVCDPTLHHHVPQVDRSRYESAASSSPLRSHHTTPTRARVDRRPRGRPGGGKRHAGSRADVQMCGDCELRIGDRRAWRRRYGDGICVEGRKVIRPLHEVQSHHVRL